MLNVLSASLVGALAAAAAAAVSASKPSAPQDQRRKASRHSDGCKKSSDARLHYAGSTTDTAAATDSLNSTVWRSFNQRHNPQQQLPPPQPYDALELLSDGAFVYFRFHDAALLRVPASHKLALSQLQLPSGRIDTAPTLAALQPQLVWQLQRKGQECVFFSVGLEATCTLEACGDALHGVTMGPGRPRARGRWRITPHGLANVKWPMHVLQLQVLQVHLLDSTAVASLQQQHVKATRSLSIKAGELQTRCEALQCAKRRADLDLDRLVAEHHTQLAALESALRQAQAELQQLQQARRSQADVMVGELQARDNRIIALEEHNDWLDTVLQVVQQHTLRDGLADAVNAAAPSASIGSTGKPTTDVAAGQRCTNAEEQHSCTSSNDDHDQPDELDSVPSLPPLPAPLWVAMLERGGPSIATLKQSLKHASYSNRSSTEAITIGCAPAATGLSSSHAADGDEQGIAACDAITDEGSGETAGDEAGACAEATPAGTAAAPQDEQAPAVAQQSDRRSLVQELAARFEASVQVTPGLTAGLLQPSALSARRGVELARPTGPQPGAPAPVSGPTPSVMQPPQEPPAALSSDAAAKGAAPPAPTAPEAPVLAVGSDTPNAASPLPQALQQCMRLERASSTSSNADDAWQPTAQPDQSPRPGGNVFLPFPPSDTVTPMGSARGRVSTNNQQDLKQPQCTPLQHKLPSPLKPQPKDTGNNRDSGAPMHASTLRVSCAAKPMESASAADLTGEGESSVAGAPPEPGGAGMWVGGMTLDELRRRLRALGLEPCLLELLRTSMRVQGEAMVHQAPAPSGAVPVAPLGASSLAAVAALAGSVWAGGVAGSGTGSRMRYSGAPARGAADADGSSSSYGGSNVVSDLGMDLADGDACEHLFGTPSGSSNEAEVSSTLRQPPRPPSAVPGLQLGFFIPSPSGVRDSDSYCNMASTRAAGHQQVDAAGALTARRIKGTGHSRNPSWGAHASSRRARNNGTRSHRTSFGVLPASGIDDPTGPDGQPQSSPLPPSSERPATHSSGSGGTTPSTSADGAGDDDLHCDAAVPQLPQGPMLLGSLDELRQQAARRVLVRVEEVDVEEESVA